MTEEVTPTPLHNLTDGQKACLRLVNAHLTSKEIARELDISPFTVDQRLDAARRKLNAASRKDAARMFALLDAATLYEPLVYKPDGIADEATLGNHGGALDQGQPAVLSTTVGDEGNNARLETGKRWRYFVPAIGGKRHDLSKKEILFQALNIAFFSTLAVTVVALILSGAMRLLS